MFKLKVIEKTIAGLGYELLGAKQDRAGVIHLTIDTVANSTRGIGSEDCCKVSDHLSYLLPVEGITYRSLEVSSPGPRRPLTKPEHFARFRGDTCKLRLKNSRQGQINFTGTIVAVVTDHVELDVDGASEQFTFEEIDAARLYPSKTLTLQGKGDNHG